MQVKQGRARIAVEEGGGIPHPCCGKILKSKTLKYAFSATLYQVFLKKKVITFPLQTTNQRLYFKMMCPPLPAWAKKWAGVQPRAPPPAPKPMQFITFYSENF